MIKSLFTGVTGLRNHQTKLDVLGNNIANVNTIGFKSSRVLFSESLSQRLTERVNPLQVGLGMQVNAVDKLYSQGALEDTGRNTDLAIQGEGFFVLKESDKNVYTRSGHFLLNTEGALIDQGGRKVQGWLLNSSRSSSTDNITSQSTGDIVFDSKMISDPTTTKNIWLSGNLNAGLDPIAEVWSSASALTTKATLTGTAAAAPVTITGGTNDQFTIEMVGGGININESLTLTAATYATVDDLVTEINNRITANANLTGNIQAVNASGSVSLKALGGSSSTTITVRSGTNDALASLGFTNGDIGSAGTNAATTTELNDLLQVSNTLVDGDTVVLSGTNPDGSSVRATFTYGTASDGTTVQSLLNSISGGYTGMAVSLANGRIVLTDNEPGESSTTITLGAGTANTGSILVPSFQNTTAGFTGKTSTSVVVYDSLGTSHTMVLEFTKTKNPGEWTWAASTSGSEQIVRGSTGQAVFDESGSLISFVYDGGVNALTLSPGNSAETMNIMINTQGDDQFSGLSQYNDVSTMSVRKQDGRASGQLQSLTINNEGTLLGSFTNGEIVNLAKIALARFENNGGLIDAGDGSLEPTAVSGDPELFAVGSANDGAIVAGALEKSNVDLSRELTELIVAQRGFQANARVITTSDTVLDELIRIKR